MLFNYFREKCTILLKLFHYVLLCIIKFTLCFTILFVSNIHNDFPEHHIDRVHTPDLLLRLSTDSLHPRSPQAISLCCEQVKMHNLESGVYLVLLRSTFLSISSVVASMSNRFDCFLFLYFLFSGGEEQSGK